MPRVSKRQVVRQRENPVAPYLFDEDSLPLRPDVVEAVRARRFEHTGEMITESDQLAGRLVELLCLGNGVKKISKLMGFSPHTVRAARRELERSGRIAPLKERFTELAGEIMLEGSKAVLAAIEEGRLHPNFMGSTVGIFADKRALALGEPTAISVSASAKLAPEAISVQSLNTWIESAPEIQSGDSGRKAQQIEVSSVVDASFDATAQPPAGQIEVRAEDLGDGGSTSAAGERAGGDGGGGGDARGEGALESDGKTGGDFER